MVFSFESSVGFIPPSSSITRTTILRKYPGYSTRSSYQRSRYFVRSSSSFKEIFATTGVENLIIYITLLSGSRSTVRVIGVDLSDSREIVIPINLAFLFLDNGPKISGDVRQYWCLVYLILP